MTIIGPPPSAQTGRSSHRNAPLDGENPISPFATPFDLPATTTTNISNGQMPTLKPGNPFPDATDHFATGPSAAFPMALKATLTNPSQPAPASSIFRSGTSTANYTNLGGLEGFGDLLQPMNSSNKGTGSSASSFGATKSCFGAQQGLSNTGLFKGDLDTTLANLAQNLTFDGISKTKK